MANDLTVWKQTRLVPSFYSKFSLVDGKENIRLPEIISACSSFFLVELFVHGYLLFQVLLSVGELHETGCMELRISLKNGSRSLDWILGGVYFGFTIAIDQLCLHGRRTLVNLGLCIPLNPWAGTTWQTDKYSGKCQGLRGALRPDILDLYLVAYSVRVHYGSCLLFQNFQ